MSVTVTGNSSFQDYHHLDAHITRLTVTPRFKPFTVILYVTGLSGDCAIQILRISSF